MALYTVGAADNKNGAVQHGERALHLGRKIHMAWRVKQCKENILYGKKRGFSKDCDSTLAFEGIGVKESVAMVDAPERTPCASSIKQCLGQGGLARVDVRQNADDDVLIHSLASSPKVSASIIGESAGLFN